MCRLGPSNPLKIGTSLTVDSALAVDQTIFGFGANGVRAREEGQKSARSVLVSRERSFSILLKNWRADPENEREVCKTFIAGSIPAVASVPSKSRDPEDQWQMFGSLSCDPSV